jgi:hypothetical protein
MNGREYRRCDCYSIGARTIWRRSAFSEICGRATSDNRSAWHVRHCTAEDGWLGREMPHTAETMG